MNRIQHLIIGAGPAGLAMAGRMRKAGLDFEIIEQSNQVGNTWHNHYDRLHLHTVKQWSHLPHLPFPADYPLYVSRQQLTQYFADYAAHFKIQPHFDVQATAITKQTNGSWEVKTQNGKTYPAENVIISTGVNRVPNRPKWPGQEKFKGSITHSVSYKNPSPYIGKSVLVVGMGNTGAEVALDLSEKGVDTFISVRHPISVVPRDLNGRPVQVTSKQLAKLPLGLGDWLGSQIRKIYFGNLSKYGLESSTMHPAVQLRETGKTPIVDIGTIKAIKEGKIKVVKEIDHFTETGVQFKTGEHIALDAVLLATGYKAKVEDFLERAEELLDQYGCPSQPIAKAFHQGIYFLGFDNYKLGGIIGTINTDSQLILEHLQK